MDDRARRILSTDPVIGPLIDRHGPVTLEPAPDPFARLVKSVISQQVSVAAAAAIAERLYDAVEVTPPALIATDEATLTAAGLSAQKAATVQALAEAFIDNGYDRSSFDELDDAAVIEEITTVRGIGPWTAKMFLMFGLGRPDVFPVEDLGIRRAMEQQIDPELSHTAMVERAEAWRPVRSYASLYLWQSID